MVMNQEQQKMSALITEAITVLCKSGLSYQSQFSVQGLLGITLDNNDIFLVNIQETINNGLEQASKGALDNESNPILVEDEEDSATTSKQVGEQVYDISTSIETASQPQEDVKPNIDRIPEWQQGGNGPPRFGIKQELPPSDCMLAGQDMQRDSSFSSSSSMLPLQSDQNMFTSPQMQGMPNTFPQTFQPPESQFGDVKPFPFHHQDWPPQGSPPKKLALGRPKPPISKTAVKQSFMKNKAMKLKKKALFGSTSGSSSSTSTSAATPQNPSEAVQQNASGTMKLNVYQKAVVHKFYECPECHKQFKSQGSFGDHVRAHQGIFRYNCQVCKKGFKAKGTLDAHLKTHDGFVA